MDPESGQTSADSTSLPDSTIQSTGPSPCTELSQLHSMSDCKEQRRLRYISTYYSVIATTKNACVEITDKDPKVNGCKPTECKSIKRKPVECKPVECKPVECKHFQLFNLLKDIVPLPSYYGSACTHISEVSENYDTCQMYVDLIIRILICHENIGFLYSVNSFILMKKSTDAVDVADVLMEFDMPEFKEHGIEKYRHTHMRKLERFSSLLAKRVNANWTSLKFEGVAKILKMKSGTFVRYLIDRVLRIYTAPLQTNFYDVAKLFPKCEPNPNGAARVSEAYHKVRVQICELTKAVPVSEDSFVNHLLRFSVVCLLNSIGTAAAQQRIPMKDGYMFTWKIFEEMFGHLSQCILDLDSMYEFVKSHRPDRQTIEDLASHVKR
jgi:hypothetical protein